MAGIYPNPEDGGVDPGITVPPSFDPVLDPVGSLAKYFSANCGVVLRPEVLNSIISQLSAAIDAAGIAFKMGNAHSDLSQAIQYYIQLNMGAYAKATGSPTALVAEGRPTFYTYRHGQILWLQGLTDNAVGNGATLAMDGLPAKRILRTDGSAVTTGDILPNMIVGLAFRDEVDAWQMVTGGTDIMAVLRTRLPIYPNVYAVNGSGQFGAYLMQPGRIYIPGGVPFMHRGVFLDNTSNYTEAERTLDFGAGNFLHLRWSPLKKFYLVHINDANYNPGGYAESNPAFDSTYDDILIATVPPSGGSNLVTNLSNYFTYKWSAVRGGTYPGVQTTTFSYTMARVPHYSIDGFMPPGGGRDTDYQVTVQTITRYSVTVYSSTWHDEPTRYGSTGYVLGLTLPGGA